MRFLSLLALPIGVALLAPACADPDPITNDPPKKDGGKDAEVARGDYELKPNAEAKVTDCGRKMTPPASGTCTETKAGSAGRIYRGSVLLPDETLHGGEVLVAADGTIACAACDCTKTAGYDTAAVTECANGVISPALINPHDHITFSNNAPAPQSTERYEHRHDWRKGIRGHTPIRTKGSAPQNVVRFAELRFVMGGAASIAGAGGQKGLLRNVDDSDPGLLEGLTIQSADSDTFPLGDTSGTLRASGCDYGTKTTSSHVKGLDGYLPHIAEGIGVEAHNELVCTTADDAAAGRNDLVQRQTAIIHAVGLSADDAALLQKDQTGVIWSPRSNVALYGNTAPVTLFDAAGIQLALGTDWVPSGSISLLRELKCADSLNQKSFAKHFSDTDLWRMVTINAAFAVGAQKVLGQLRPGYVADIAIFDGKDRKDHRAIIDGGVEDVALVLRGGVPLYGDADLMDALGQSACESFDGDVCGVPKKACVMRETGVDLTAIRTAGEAIYPLFFCRNETPKDEPSCVPWREQYPDGITEADMDGDGLKNEEDNCPTIFNPIRPLDGNGQADIDVDGVGDVCDRCPNDRENACTPPSGNDVDGDGLPNGADNCPEDPNPDQADADKDGKGDLCDSCKLANPGATPCTVSVLALRDPNDPAHPKSGTTVSVSGLYVTALSPTPNTGSNKAFYAQTGTDPLSGIAIATGSAPQGVVIGNKVTVTGVYAEVFGITTISAPTIKIEDPGTTLPFAPIPVAPSEIATGGAKAEALECMLVSVSGALAITNDIPDGAANKFYEFTITGGLRIDDAIFTRYGTAAAGAYPPPPYLVGKTFTKITGIQGFSFNNQKLWPRTAADLQ